MKQLIKKTLVAASLLAAGLGSAWADITVGVIVPMTGPASGLGIPMSNGVKMWPASVAGEKHNVMILDDATEVVG